MNAKNRTIKQNARQKLLGGYSEHCAYAILLGGLEVLSGWIMGLFIPGAGMQSFIFGLIVSAVLQVLLFVFYAGAALHFLKTLRGELSPLTDFIEPLRRSADRYLVVGLIEVAVGYVLMIPIYAACVLPDRVTRGALIFSAVWLIAGGIAYIVFLANFALSIFILLDDPAVSPLAAMKMSAEKMRGKKGSFVLLVLSFIGYGLLVIFTFGLGLIWVLPYFLASVAGFYEDAK